MTVIEFKRPGDQEHMARKLIDPDIDESTTPWRWYLIRCKPGQWRKAKFEIRRAGFRAVVIMERVEREHHRRRHNSILVRKQPAFDRYLFVRMPRLAPNWYRLRTCAAVEGVMTTFDAAGEIAPFAIQWKVVARLMEKQRRGGFDQTEDGRRRRGEIVKSKVEQRREIFRPGTRLKVKSGPFATFDATVVDVDRHGAVDVLVEIFGRDTPLHFTDPAELEVIEHAKSEMARDHHQGPRAA